LPHQSQRQWQHLVQLPHLCYSSSTSSLCAIDPGRLHLDVLILMSAPGHFLPPILTRMYGTVRLVSGPLRTLGAGEGAKNYAIVGESVSSVEAEYGQRMT
jgi:hypothetical protein